MDVDDNRLRAFFPNPKAVISSFSINEMRKAAKNLPIRTCLYLTQSIQSAVVYGSRSFSGDVGFAGIAWTLCDVVQRILNKDILLKEDTILHGISCDRSECSNQFFGSNKYSLVDIINNLDRMSEYFSWDLGIQGVLDRLTVSWGDTSFSSSHMIHRTLVEVLSQ